MNDLTALHVSTFPLQVQLYKEKQKKITLKQTLRLDLLVTGLTE